MGEKCIVDFFGVFDVVHREIVPRGQYIQPFLCRVHKWLMNPARLREHNHAKARRLLLGECGDRHAKPKRKNRQRQSAYNVNIQPACCAPHSSSPFCPIWFHCLSECLAATPQARAAESSPAPTLPSVAYTCRRESSR